jgi:Tannase-like family of unknown function (DUF6351)
VGILDDGPKGACAQAFPIFETSRIVAGGPIEGGVLACERQPVERAAARGLYAPWVPSTSDVARLKEVFPDGVGDYTKGDAGLPPELNARGRWVDTRARAATTAARPPVSGGRP